MQQPGKPVEEGTRRIRNRRGQSFNPAEVRVANMLLDPAQPTSLFLSPEEEKALATLRTKFTKMEQSLKLATV